MNKEAVIDLVEDATFDFTMGDYGPAMEKLEAAIEADGKCFEAWHAKCEVHHHLKQYAKALESAEKAHGIRPEDIHINTSLSRIWVEMGDKERAEHFGAQARMLSWKEQIREGEGSINSETS